MKKFFIKAVSEGLGIGLGATLIAGALTNGKYTFALVATIVIIWITAKTCDK